MSRLTRAPSLRIEVAENLIREAVPRDSGRCWIAEAVRATYPNAARIAVDVQTIRFSDPEKGLRYTYLTPRVAQLALVAFDQGVVPAPFSITLRNGQVTRAGTRSPKRKLSPAETRQRREAGKKGNAAQQDALKRAQLAPGPGNSVPDRVGGRTPPRLPPSARRREFGLRSMVR